ncbi:helix-turn-helix domain-containing protein [Pseudomonas abietaniphila]|uniref:helix-turn-helix domain-containing protein n=1 Tax=Pseudomonas abietaniphila TaxID=89065 RepID=UPI0007802713|nr:helix-turn-helix transcriptional regulator [Pseudomonas abietaniphila]
MTKVSHQQKVEAIRASGLSYAEIAERCSVDTSTIFRIRQGSIADPRYSVGLAIDDLYCSTQRKKARQAA